MQIPFLYLLVTLTITSVTADIDAKTVDVRLPVHRPEEIVDKNPDNVNVLLTTLFEMHHNLIAQISVLEDKLKTSIPTTEKSEIKRMVEHFTAQKNNIEVSIQQIQSNDGIVINQSRSIAKDSSVDPKSIPLLVNFFKRTQTPNTEQTNPNIGYALPYPHYYETQPTQTYVYQVSPQANKNGQVYMSADQSPVQYQEQSNQLIQAQFQSALVDPVYQQTTQQIQPQFQSALVDPQYQQVQPQFQSALIDPQYQQTTQQIQPQFQSALTDPQYQQTIQQIQPQFQSALTDPQNQQTTQQIQPQFQSALTDPQYQQQVQVDQQISQQFLTPSDPQYQAQAQIQGQSQVEQQIQPQINPQFQPQQLIQPQKQIQPQQQIQPQPQPQQQFEFESVFRPPSVPVRRPQIQEYDTQRYQQQGPFGQKEGVFVYYPNGVIADDKDRPSLANRFGQAIDRFGQVISNLGNRQPTNNPTSENGITSEPRSEVLPSAKDKVKSSHLKISSSQQKTKKTVDEKTTTVTKSKQ